MDCNEIERKNEVCVNGMENDDEISYMTKNNEISKTKITKEKILKTTGFQEEEYDEFFSEGETAFNNFLNVFNFNLYYNSTDKVQECLKKCNKANRNFQNYLLQQNVIFSIKKFNDILNQNNEETIPIDLPINSCKR